MLLSKKKLFCFYKNIKTLRQHSLNNRWYRIVLNGSVMKKYSFVKGLLKLKTQIYARFYFETNFLQLGSYGK